LEDPYRHYYSKIEFNIFFIPRITEDCVLFLLPLDYDIWNKIWGIFLDKKNYWNHYED
jgi:hypothetical protein